MYEIFVKLLQEHGMSVYQFSKATGIAQSTLSDWKRGKSRPRNDKLKKIADYFGVSVDYLLGRVEQTKNEPATTQSDSELDDLDKLLMDFVHRLTADQKKLLLAQLKLMLETQ